MELIDHAGYEVRQATFADIPELIRMQMALQRDMDGIRCNMLRPNRTNITGLREYYRSRIEDERTQLLVALAAESSKAVGMCAGQVWLHADYLPAKSGELIDLWVDPEHRGKSLARRIIAQLLRFFRVNGIDFLVVSYVEGNQVGEALWKRLGFEPVLITAAANRERVERALGMPVRQAVPRAYRTLLAGTSSVHMTSAPAV